MALAGCNGNTFCSWLDMFAMFRGASIYRALRFCALPGVTLALSGCVAAAVAVPTLTAVGAITEKKRAPAATPTQPASAVPPANGSADGNADAPEIVLLTDLADLPPPSAGPRPAAAWRAFADFATQGALRLAEGEEVQSALLAAESAAGIETRRRLCTGREPAVIVDLDPADAAFAPDAARSARPEIAAELARLREAGVVVLWISRLGAKAVMPVADAIRQSGLDPTGRDPILLVRHEEERKQVLREEANRSVCVLAMAGDERGDFDELFDYLRDPEMAAMYDSLLGSGWFIVSQPFAEPPVIEVPEVSAAPPAGEDGGR